ncbi:set5 [Symbiodinium natans]|uniref:Set5 protein n=1 Tax=Symbiodinium natans TaxID=878477 RepID=A0A812GT01_9DINO|nr:set5 [Symbiodinium natans]
MEGKASALASRLSLLLSPSSLAASFAAAWSQGYGVVASRPFRAGERIYEEPPALVVDSEDSMQAQLLQTVAATVFLVINVLLGVSGAGVAIPFVLGAGGAYLWFRSSRDGLSVPDELKEQWEALPEEKREALASLSDCSAGEKTLSGIIDTNAFSRGASATSSSLVVCPTLARLNHSCSPNCQQSWDGTSGMEKLYAMSDISEGEELCITYCDLRRPRAERKQELKAKYGFECTCPACSTLDSAQSDANRVAIARLEEELCREGPANPTSGLLCAEELLATIDAEGLSDKMLRGLACYEAMECALRLGNEEAVTDWAAKAHLYLSQARGSDNSLAREAKKCSESPTQHPLWAGAATKKVQTSAGTGCSNESTFQLTHCLCARDLPGSRSAGPREQRHPGPQRCKRCGACACNFLPSC